MNRTHPGYHVGSTVCECREVIDPARVSPELQIGGEKETWKVVVAPVGATAFEFTKRSS